MPKEADIMWDEIDKQLNEIRDKAKPALLAAGMPENIQIRVWASRLQEGDRAIRASYSVWLYGPGIYMFGTAADNPDLAIANVVADWIKKHREKAELEEFKAWKKAQATAA
jgi:hypothetical protein